MQYSRPNFRRAAELVVFAFFQVAAHPLVVTFLLDFASLLTLLFPFLFLLLLSRNIQVALQVDEGLELRADAVTEHGEVDRVFAFAEHARRPVDDVHDLSLIHI